MIKEKLSSSLNPYVIQLDRIKRWKVKIEKTIDDYRNGKYSEDIRILLDMIYAFFIFCHHMSDYIKNDNELSIDEDIIYEYIRKNECLSICADICNGTKHLTLTRPKTEGGHFWVNYKININSKTKERTISVTLSSKTVNEEFSSLADNCIQKWEKFIENEIR